MTIDLRDWKPRPFPPHEPLQGRFIRLAPLDAARHGDDLWQELEGPDPAIWDYLPYGPFPERAAFDAWLANNAASEDPQFYTVLDARGRALGLLGYLRIVPKDGCIELGHVAFGASMQRTPAATEAVYLLARRAFDELGYRRFEWKCNSRNARSIRAAERFGFSYEGLFRQQMVIKGENRDTTWFSIIDGEWPTLRSAFERWLAEENFDGEGRQRKRLEELRA